MKYIKIIVLLSLFSFQAMAQINFLNEQNILQIDQEFDANRQITLDEMLNERLDRTLLESATDIEVVGAGASIIFPNGESWSGVFGQNSTANPVTLENSFAVGSVSKSITSSCILKLVEENLLSLDDSIGQWIPTNPNIDPLITVRQCLNHTSGVYDYSGNGLFLLTAQTDFTKIWDPLEILNTYLGDPVFERGTNWSYCNTNYLLAGLVIEGVTGKPYHEVVREKVLDPNGFSEIKLYPQETLNNPITDLWLDLGTGAGAVDALENGIQLNSILSGAWAAGAYTATPKDISLWMKKLVKGDILSESSMNEMMDFTPLSNNRYGLGVSFVPSEGANFIGHNGEILYTSMVYYIDALDISIAIHTNDGTANGDDIDDIFTALLEAYYGYITPSADINQDQNIYTLSPNPVSNELHIDVKKSYKNPIQITIYNTVGQVVKTLETINTDISLPVSNLEKGLYFLEIRSNEINSTTSFIRS